VVARHQANQLVGEDRLDLAREVVAERRDYELTPFARDLLLDVQRVVRLMRSALQLEEVFDPATSERTFRLAMSDYAISILHEPLVRLVENDAPGVRLSINHMVPASTCRTGSWSTTTYSLRRRASDSPVKAGRCGVTG
jgi:hypothetical protein